MKANGSMLAAALLIGGGVFAAPVAAQNGDSRFNAMAACGTIAKKSARLACYDAMAPAPGTASAQPSAEPAPAPAEAPAAAPAVAAVAPAPGMVSGPAAAPSFGGQKARSASSSSFGAAPAPRRSGAGFGGEQLRNGRQVSAKELTAQASAVADDGIGHYTVTLDDGARWKMTELQAQFVPPNPGDPIRIRKASLGSYLMDVKGQPAVRVVRVE
jgi:hypothetical protein